MSIRFVTRVQLIDYQRNIISRNTTVHACFFLYFCVLYNQGKIAKQRDIFFKKSFNDQRTGSPRVHTLFIITKHKSVPFSCIFLIDKKTKSNRFSSLFLVRVLV